MYNLCKNTAHKLTDPPECRVWQQFGDEVGRLTIRLRFVLLTWDRPYLAVYKA